MSEMKLYMCVSLCEGVKVIKSVSVHKSGQERLRVSLSVRICEYASVYV